MTEYTTLDQLVFSGGNTSIGDSMIMSNGSVYLRAEKRGEALGYSNPKNFTLSFPVDNFEYSQEYNDFALFIGDSSLINSTWSLDSTQFEKYLEAKRYWGHQIQWRREIDSLRHKTIVKLLDSKDSSSSKMAKIKAETKALDYRSALSFPPRNIPGFITIPAFGLGSINCDRYLGLRQNQRQIVKVNTDNLDQSVYRALIFPRFGATTPPINSNNEIAFYNTPLDVNRVYLAIKREGDNYFACIQSVDAESSQINETELKAMSMEDIYSEVKRLMESI